ncbi:MAG: nucleoside triphosphate pyrophosphohydrolase [Acidobacteria bacterium]|nr:nucleoside triphosphate pyrophosphohydrolase [Acidobacteriota bacterium]
MAGESLPKLVELMAHLRGPEGCPWDRAQDYDSAKGLLLEEAYEVIDAINQRDFAGVEEELGDLLFQVVFYSRLAEEEGKFDIDRVIEGVYEKLIRRHPHVFGEKRARTPEEALESWTAVKENERGPNARGASVLDGIAPALPSTLEAYELGLRAAEAGFDWAKLEDVLDKVEEELREFRKEAASHPAAEHPKLEEELGDLLFAVANVARQIRSDPESCLRAANQKFRRRFQALEEEVKRRGKSVRACTPEELDNIWELHKARENR